MARTLNRLTSNFVKAVQPKTGSTGPAMYSDGGNLNLQVGVSGTKSWIFRYTLGGRPHNLGLGTVQTVSLNEAREEAQRLRRMLASGKDPKLELAREQHAASLSRGRTFRVFADEFVAGLEGSHRNKKAHAQWTSSLQRYAYPVIGDVPLAEVDVHMVLTILTRDDAWKQKNETMRRVRGRIERILGAAAVLGLRTADNPARFTNFLSEVLPRPRLFTKVKHHPSLPFEQIPRFIHLLRLESAASYRALEFLTLTATRTSEVTGATWSEIDWEKGVWAIPEHRMKAGRMHRVPLSAAALCILEKQAGHKHGLYIFPGARRGTPLSQMAMLQAMRGMRERGLIDVEAVPHGQRAAFRSWAAAATEFPRELAEAALAHSLSALEQSYQRDDQLDRRRPLMDAWAAYCGEYLPAEVLYHPKPDPSGPYDGTFHQSPSGGE